MDKETQLWNEYQNLRCEILQANNLNYQILAGVIAVTGAILVAGFNNYNSPQQFFIFLCIYAVTFPVYRLLCGNHRRIWRISTYICVFLEPEFDFINWETRLDKARQLANLNPNTLSSNLLRNEFLVIFLLNSVAGISAIIALLSSQADQLVQLVSVLFIIVLNVFLTSYMFLEEKKLRRVGDEKQQSGNLGKVRRDFMKSWEKVKKDSGNKKLRPFGLCAGEFTVPDNFDDPLSEDILKGFEGR
jgi:hypothetical protein